MLAWQNCLSVLVKSIALKCAEDDYACLAELPISVGRKHHSECGKDDFACLAELLICV